MSLLLDALRKSERQRKLGQAPDIEVPSMRTDSPSGRPYHWLLLLVLVAAAVGWWLLAANEEDRNGRVQGVASEQTPLPDRSTTNPADAQRDAAEQAAARSGADASSSSDVRQSASRAAAVAQQDQAQQFNVPQPRTSLPAGPDLQRSTASSDGTRGSLSRELPTAMDTAPQTAASLDDLARLSAAATQSDSAAAAVDKAAMSSAAVTAVASNSTEPGADPAAERDANNWRPGQPEPISYYELPVTVRQDLEDFRVTIRIYNEDPEKRFAVINQQRFFEGDDVGQGLRLQEIRRDGVVFEFDQYRFLLR